MIFYRLFILSWEKRISLIHCSLEVLLWHVKSCQLCHSKIPNFLYKSKLYDFIYHSIGIFTKISNKCTFFIFIGSKNYHDFNSVSILWSKKLKMKMLWSQKLIWSRLKVSSNNVLLCWVTLVVVSGKFSFHTIIMTSWLVVLHEK